MPANGLYGLPQGYGATSPIISSMNLVADVRGDRISAFNINNCFSSAYDNYRVYGTLSSWSNTGQILVFRFIDRSGVMLSASYDNVITYASTSGVFGVNLPANTYARLNYPYSDSGAAQFIIDIVNPNVETRTTYRSWCFSRGNVGGGDWNSEFEYGATRVTNRFTGIQCLTTGGIMTTRMSVYGYSNS